MSTITHPRNLARAASVLVLSSSFALGLAQSPNQDPFQPGRPQIAVNSTGSEVAVVGPRKVSLFWRDNGKLPKVIPIEHGVCDVAFTPDGKRLLVAMADGGIGVVDASTGNPVERLQHSTSPAWQMAVSPDGSLAAVTGKDNEVEVWDLRNLSWVCNTRSDEETKTRSWSTVRDRDGRVSTLYHDESTDDQPTISADNQYLATAGNYIRIWSLPSGKLLHEIKARAACLLAWNKTENILMDLSGGHAWNARSGEGILFKNDTTNVFGHLPRMPLARQVGLTGDIVFVDQGGTVCHCPYGAEQYISGPDLKPWTFDNSSRRTSATALDATGRFVANIRSDIGQISVWSAADGKLLWSR